MTQQLTGYPSIDKPWLKYYSEEAINAPLPEMTLYQYIWENNKDHLSDVALRYYGTRITYGKLLSRLKRLLLHSMPWAFERAMPLQSCPCIRQKPSCVFTP